MIIGPTRARTRLHVCIILCTLKYLLDEMPGSIGAKNAKQITEIVILNRALKQKQNSWWSLVGLASSVDRMNKQQKSRSVS